MPALLSRPAPSPTSSGSSNSFGAPKKSFGSQKPFKSSTKAGGDGRPKEEAKILFQKFFKSVGPRTYAAQLKEAGNGNHFLVLTEGKRDEKTGEVRKTRLFVFSEDFPAFFNLVADAADFAKANPVPPEVAKRQATHWKKATTAPSNRPG